MSDISHLIDGDDGNVAALLAAGAAIGGPRIPAERNAKAYALVPHGFDLQETPIIGTPQRPAGLVKLRDTASFIAYFNLHAVERSQIYATMEPPRFLAVFDDFDSVKGGSDDVDEQSDWREFRASFDVPYSREWKTWAGIDRKPLTQLAFAQFLEDNLPDVAVPAAADLLQMILDFEAKLDGKVVSVQRLQDGSTNLAFQADNNASGSVKLPEQILLRLPVFENDDAVDLAARLRYTIKRDDGSITFRIELVRPHKAAEAAFRVSWGRIESSTGTAILLGTPE
jgi:uncharacterized protein YfdQ (DUF2303 family)